MRNKAIDITKAIGILLMILGHCAGIPGILRNFIFSFHMPLFFILSGYFYKPKEIKDIVSSNNKHLLKPYLITALVCIVLNFTAGGIDKALAKVVGTIMSNGGWPNELIGANLPYIGPIWFLMALYWCKIFYEYLRRHTENTLLWTFVVSTLALVIGKYIINLPFGILTGFCGMVFYAMGDCWRRKAPLSLNKPLMGGATCLDVMRLESPSGARLIRLQLVPCLDVCSLRRNLCHLPHCKAATILSRTRNVLDRSEYTTDSFLPHTR